MVLFINGYMRGMDLSVGSSNRRVVADMVADVSVILPSAESEVTVYFFEKYVETLRLIRRQVFEANESSDVYAKYVDEDGSIIQDNAIVHFFEIFTPNFSLFAEPNAIEEEEFANLNCRLRNEEGGLSVGSTVYFFEKMIYDYFNRGDTVAGLSIESGVNVTSEDGALRISTSTNGEKRCSYPIPLTDSDNYTFECTIAKQGNIQPIGMFVKNSTTATGLWFANDYSNNKFSIGCTGTSGRYNAAVEVGDKITIKRENGVMSILHNDITIYSKRTNFGGTYYIGHYTNKDRVQYVKNIKIIKE